jgi:guanylate kinase
MTRIGTLFIISAPSGAGKTSLVQQITNKLSNIVRSISYTTRAKRSKEQDGLDYFFINEKIFLQMKNNKEFLENAEIFGNHYGTSKKFVVDLLNQGKDVILEIDYQGAKQIKSQLDVSFSACLSIFILPPSLQTLTKRLTSRGQDEPTVIQQRLNTAKTEMQHYINYDYLVINDNFDRAIQDLSTIINAQQLSIVKQKVVNASLINDLLI